MSAESPQRRSQIRANGAPNTVTPQHVTDPTILDSVAGFINDVVPTAYNLPNEIDDKIQWAHFEQLENDDVAAGLNYDGDNVLPAPLILVLGYTNGIQIWAIPATGEATEILSWRHSTLRTLKILPTPFKTGSGDNHDLFASARPLIALCDSTANFCTLTFRSLKAAAQDPVKQIQFKTSILNVLANRHSVVVSFAEKIAIFDAFTLESRMSITTCYLSPGVQQNPIALSSKWLAYAEKKLINLNRSGGGNEGEGVQSYTATVLHAAKSLGRGLRELTETVAGSLTGNPNFKPVTSSSSSPQAGGVSDVPQKGIVTILDIENKNINAKENLIPQDAVIAHFVAHSEAIVCLEFDPSGMLLLTADKRGHDFHVFRIHPHPSGPALAAIHHLYILHRGDTSAKVQDMCFSPDSRWITVSTLRGTTHVFPVTPYGGNINVRTHASAHVVNKMSRYQRSAGLTSEGRSSSPVSLSESPVNSLFPYRNPRFPPYPQPTIVHPLAQIRQPVYIQSNGVGAGQMVGGQRANHAGRQRLSSSSEENISLRLVTCFAAARAWMETINTQRETTTAATLKNHVKPIESLFIMSCYGTLVQYDLEPHPLTSVPKDKICNETTIELKVLAKAQWALHRQPNAIDIPLPLTEENLNLIAQNIQLFKKTKPDHNDDHWLSQVEIVTHLGPHRRLWMGPQFTFKTYTITNGSVLETRSVDVRRSKPVNMPVSKANAILIESGSANSCEQLFLDTYHKACEEVGSVGESRLKEDLAEAMLESPGIRDQGGHCVIVSMKKPRTTTTTTSSTTTTTTATVAKVVNPLGTVVTIHSDIDDDDLLNQQNEIVEEMIHENCDEALFRPVVAPKAIFYSDNNCKSKQIHSENMLTKSLAANTEVAVRILNKKDNDDNNKYNNIASCNNKKIINNNNKCVTPSTKHIKSCEPSLKVIRTSSSTTTTTNVAVTSSINKNEISNKNNKTKFNKVEANIKTASAAATTTIANVVAGNKVNKKAEEDEKSEKDVADFPSKLSLLDSFTNDLPPFEFNVDDESLPKPPDSPLFESILKFEDAEDCCNESFVTPPKTTTSTTHMTTNTSTIDDEKVLTKKNRKPKPKLGVKITKDKENTASNLLDDLPPIAPVKKSWNIVAATKPKDKLADSQPSVEIESVVESYQGFKMTDFLDDERENLIDIANCKESSQQQLLLEDDDIEIVNCKNELQDDCNLIKIDNKSSDDEKLDSGGGSQGETTTESDDSTSKIPPVVVTTIADVDDDDTGPIITLHASSKSSKRKSKKKRK